MTHRYEDPHDTPQRAPYSAPRLTLLGSLAEMTLGPLGGQEDGLNGNLDSEILP